MVSNATQYLDPYEARRQELTFHLTSQCNQAINTQRSSIQRNQNQLQALHDKVKTLFTTQRQLLAKELPNREQLDEYETAIRTLEHDINLCRLQIEQDVQTYYLLEQQKSQVPELVNKILTVERMIAEQTTRSLLRTLRS